jgi:hypothetical protein
MKYRCPHCESLNVPGPGFSLQHREKGIICPDCYRYLRSHNLRPRMHYVKLFLGYLLVWVLLITPTVLLVYASLNNPNFSSASFFTPKGRGWFLLLLAIPVGWGMTALLPWRIRSVWRLTLAQQPIIVPEESDHVEPEVRADTGNEQSEPGEK